LIIQRGAVNKIAPFYLATSYNEQQLADVYAVAVAAGRGRKT